MLFRLQTQVLLEVLKFMSRCGLLRCGRLVSIRERQFGVSPVVYLVVLMSLASSMFATLTRSFLLCSWLLVCV